MATGKQSDFIIYEEQFFGGQTEILQQQTILFNEASRGAVRLVPRRLKGNFEQESFTKLIANLISRRDPTSVAAVEDKKVEQGEFIGCKVDRRIGPVAQTLDAWRKIAQDPEMLSFIVGQQVGKAQMVDYVNTALIAIEAALAGQADLQADITGWGTSTLHHTGLVEGLSKMGDAADQVVAWVSHSKPVFDLMKNTISEKIFEVAGMTVLQGTVASLGRPIIVTDSSALVKAGPTYTVLGLVDGAAEVTESEEREIRTDIELGKENIIGRLQGEYAFNIRQRGFAYDSANGLANPDDTALGTSSNWDKVVTDRKQLTGVRLLCN